MRVLSLILVALCVATTAVNANVFTDLAESMLMPAAPPAVKATTLAPSQPRDVSAAFDAVTDYVFTDDAAAFRGGRSTPLRVHATRRSGHGHPQPYASQLHLAFSAHGHRFSFDALQLNYHIFDADFEMRVENAEAGTVEMYRPPVTAYTGVSSDGAATANVVVCPASLQVHAHILHHATGRLFRLDHLNRHVHRFGKRHADLTAAAGEHGMVLLRDAHTANDVVLHHDLNAAGADGNVAMSTSPIEALKMRKLLAETRNGKKNDAERWNKCYSGVKRGLRSSIGIAVDSEWYRQAKDWSGTATGVDQKTLTAREVAEVVNDTNLLYNAQMNIEFTIGQSVVQATQGGPVWNYKPQKNGQKPNYHWSNRCSQPNAHHALNAFEKWRKDEHKKDRAIWHLLTGCSYDKGVLGIAWVGTMCKTTLSTAITSGFSNGHDASWKTFAHEIGHNFGAQHSFEDGQGKTGGIMDYGDGKLAGIYQFNTKYRKNEICKVVKKAMSAGWFSFGNTKKCFDKK